jgi:outer membrane protein assembly factor BamB
MNSCSKTFNMFVRGSVIMVLFISESHASDWLQWGGPKGDFTVESSGLADKWPEGGPKQLWKRPLGDGYSSVLSKNGRLITEYRVGDEAVIVSLDAQTGATNWEHRYAFQLWPDMEKSFGLGPNATPLIIRDRIVSISIDGHVRCLDFATGKLLWEYDLPAKFGRRKRVEEYGYSGSPLPYQNNVIVQVGGDHHAVVAFDPENGSVVWKSEPGGVSYAQATITSLAGRDQYIYFEPEGVVGLDPSSGRLLWRSAIEFNNGNHLTPIVQCDDNHIWVGSQFTTGGGRLLELSSGDRGLSVAEKWFAPKLRATHSTFICLGDHLYGSFGGNDVSYFMAVEWRTGKITWRQRGMHKALGLHADGKLIALDETGLLTLAKISPAGLTVLDSAQVTEAVSWTLPTLDSTTLFVRDQKNLTALNLAGSAP